MNLLKLDWSDWLYGLLQGVISGGAGAVSGGVAAPMIDSDHFNSAHPARILELMTWMFVLNGAFKMFMYLSTKPLPSVVTTTTATVTTANATTVVSEKKVETIVPTPPTIQAQTETKQG